MKKILNKIGQVLQVVLAAPVKWPGKAGNILKYIAVGLGILETVMEEEKPPPEPSPEKQDPIDLPRDNVQEKNNLDQIYRRSDGEAIQQNAERSEADAME
ncbi:hypothetical protein [Sphingobacterium multivorum]|uniref:hypothetical protein n=1 Tax=Sphingobacterium multivorum TaxID=28454 RepID=UPI0028A9D381|nr:hypothetical protein [Sphingobacterium multivorum]